MRLFISIDIPSEITKKIKEIQDKLPEFNGKKTESENLHLTLKFLGEVEDDKLKIVVEKLKKIKFQNFETQIGSIGIFDENFVRIIWLHLSNCERLQREVDGVLGGLFEKEERFMGHLTIARVKKVEGKKEFIKKIREIKFSSINFSVSSFKLKKSILTPFGPRYETIEEFQLIPK